MKILIVGSGGLGLRLWNYWSKFIISDNSYDELYIVNSKTLNITNYKQCKIYLEEIKPDIIINLAGKNFDKFIHKLDISNQEEISNLLDANIRGTINLVSAALPGMRERNYGRIVLISSILSTKNIMGTGLYSSCKAFIDRFVKTVSLENISKGITCNSIRLGYFEGGMTERLPDPERIKQEIPLKRWGTIKELYDTIQYLINTEYVTGTNIEINGGL